MKAKDFNYIFKVSMQSTLVTCTVNCRGKEAQDEDVNSTILIINVCLCLCGAHASTLSKLLFAQWMKPSI